MKSALSLCSLTASDATGAQKLGHPVPDSNLVADQNSGAPQQTHEYFVPVRAGKCPLGSMLARDVELFRRQRLAPLGIALDDFRSDIRGRRHGATFLIQMKKICRC
jgi:hypothetical protein